MIFAVVSHVFLCLYYDDEDHDEFDDNDNDNDDVNDDDDDDAILIRMATGA